MRRDVREMWRLRESVCMDTRGITWVNFFLRINLEYIEDEHAIFLDKLNVHNN